MKSEKSIPLQILELLKTQALPAGSHLPAQMLADRLQVSRSPVNEALNYLHDQGVLRRERNRGYFVSDSAHTQAAHLSSRMREEGADPVAGAYFRIAEDRLRGELPDEFSETLIRTRYHLTSAQLNAMLARIASEGWIEKKLGYGWRFSTMLTTADSLLQSYRLRLALEPAALLEPGYRLAPEVIARCRAAERHLLDGGIETDTADQLHERGVRFHESLVEGSHNAFFIDTIRRVNRVRRLLSYRSMQDRSRYLEHCEQHLHLLDLLQDDRTQEASAVMRDHLSSTMRNLERIAGILKA